MMIRRTLNNHPSVDHETQRKNIFHTRCKVLEIFCSPIVDMTLAAIVVALGWLRNLIYN